MKNDKTKNITPSSIRGKGNIPVRQETEDEKKDFPGYPSHSTKDDIYNKDKEIEDIDPEDIAKMKEPNETSGKRNEKNFKDDLSGSDLDVPGSELDDDQEKVGSEDEENNYYSIGGDDHNDLDEDKGD